MTPLGVRLALRLAVFLALSVSGGAAAHRWLGFGLDSLVALTAPCEDGQSAGERCALTAPAHLWLEPGRRLIQALSSPQSAGFQFTAPTQELQVSRLELRVPRLERGAGSRSRAPPAVGHPA